MGIFNKYGPCRGITFFRLGQFRAEIWFIPANYEIVEHRHPEEDVELMYLMGSTVFFRRDIKTGIPEKATMTWRKFGKCFSVMNYHSHWFTVGKWPLVFINFQKFLPGIKPKSAAKDFLETTKDLYL